MKFTWLTLPLIAIVLGVSQPATSSINNDVTPHIERSVIEVSNLQQLARQMEKDSLGLVLMFHAEYCEYCERLEEDLLQPMVRSGDYDQKVLIRKIQVDGSYDLIHFDGSRISSEKLSSHYDASLTPTLVFLDAKGVERSEKILGYNTPELFGAYVDRAIEQLHKAVLNTPL